MKTTSIIYICILVFKSFLLDGASPALSAALPPSDSRLEQCSLLIDSGRFEEAAAKCAETARLFAQAGRNVEHADAMSELARAYQSLGRYREAAQQLTKAIQSANRSSDRKKAGVLLSRLAEALLSAGLIEEAGKSLDEASLITDSQSDPENAAFLLLVKAQAHSAQNRHQEALKECELGIAALAKTQSPLIHARLRTQGAAALLKMDNAKVAAQWLDEAYRQYHSIGNSHQKAFGLIAVARGMRQVSMVDGGKERTFSHLEEAALTDAMSISEGIGDPRALSYALGYLSQMRQEQGDLKQSLDFIRRAIFTAQEIPAPEILYLWEWQSGRIHKAMGDAPSAIAVYKLSIATLQSIRQDMAEGCGPASFQESVSPLFFEFADLLLQQAHEQGTVKGGSPYLLQAREAVESFKAVELQDYFQDPCVTQNQSRKMNLDSISSDAAVVYSITFPDRLELLVSMQGQMRRHTVSMSIGRLSDTIRQLRIALENRTKWEYQTHSRALYDALIRPLEPDFAAAGIKTLVMVPDGALRTVPLAALHDGSAFLVEKYAVVTTPGINLTEASSADRRNMKVLSAGITESVQGYPALKNVKTEFQGIYYLYSGKKYEDRDFSANAVQEHLQQTPYSIVHIATHGEFGHRAADTFLLTWDGKMDMDHLDRMIRQSRFRKDQVELLTLSACQTAAGDERAALGLAGVAVKAGAKSALATLWNVNDEATSELILEFYRQLSDPSLTKAEALRQAQMKMISNPHHRHPFYWSPFLIIGNWL